MKFCLLFMRSICFIFVFWLNLIMFYQPVMVVCSSMRCRWGKERRIGDEKNCFFESHFFKEKMLFFSSEWLLKQEVRSNPAYRVPLAVTWLTVRRQPASLNRCARSPYPRGTPQSGLQRLAADPGDIPAEPEKTREVPDGIGKKVLLAPGGEEIEEGFSP